jgi:hypothetical protein
MTMTSAIHQERHSLFRLTPRRVQEVLDQAIADIADPAGHEVLSRLFLEGLRHLVDAQSIRVLELAPTGLQTTATTGTVTSAGVLESVLKLRLQEQQPGLVEHTPEELIPGCHAGTPGESVSTCYTVFTELAPGVGLLLELCFSPGRGLAEWSDSAGEIFADLRRRELVLQHRRLLDRFGLSELLIQQLHRATDVQDILQMLTSDAAAVLGCFRLTVCERAAGNWRLAAASGGRVVNERADEVRRICGDVQHEESRALAPTPTPTPTLAPAVDPVSPARQTGNRGNTAAAVLVVPLSMHSAWQNARFALHIEYRTGAVRDAVLQDRIIHHAVIALHNRDPRSRSVSHGWPRRKLLLALLSGIIVAGILAAIPVELTIHASGSLQPARRRSVFAEESGIVEELLVQDGSLVRSSDVLLRLRNDELLLQRETLLGELSGVQARSAALDALRSARDGQQPGVLPGEQAELAARGQSLRRQLEIVERRLSSLDVRAPLAGHVLTEDLRERFSGRPVQRGQHLCDLGDLQGAWELRLNVSELEIRHVLQAAGTARTTARNAPEIRFCIETNPDTSHTVPLATVSGVTEIDERGQTVTAVNAIVPAGEVEGRRPGAGVRAAIHCGRAPAGYVYFRRLIDLALRRILL